MVLEACVLCLDNSEWTRNGDYSPSRYDAQMDTVNALCRAHMNDSPENTVGIISTAGERVVVNVTLTIDPGNIITGLHDIKIEGRSNFVEAIQVAQLALKYRTNKNHGRRIILFVGSPIEESQRELERLGGRLKKNGVSVDVVSFGENNINDTKLTAFVNAVNNRDNCTLVSVPAGASIITTVRGSAILGGGGSGQGDFDQFGIDPNMDPELAAAIAESMRGLEPVDETPINDDFVMGGIEDEELLRAIQLSMMDVHDFDDTVSNQEDNPSDQNDVMEVDIPEQDELDERDFMSGLLSSLPGVDVNDPSIQDFLTTFNSPDKDKKDDDG